MVPPQKKERGLVCGACHCSSFTASGLAEAQPAAAPADVIDPSGFEPAKHKQSVRFTTGRKTLRFDADTQALFFSFLFLSCEQNLWGALLPLRCCVTIWGFVGDQQLVGSPFFWLSCLQLLSEPRVRLLQVGPWFPPMSILPLAQKATWVTFNTYHD